LPHKKYLFQRKSAILRNKKSPAQKVREISKNLFAQNIHCGTAAIITGIVYPRSEHIAAEIQTGTNNQNYYYE